MACLDNYQIYLQCKYGKKINDLVLKLSFGIIPSEMILDVLILQGYLNTLCRDKTTYSDNCLDEDTLCGIINHTIEILNKC